LQAIGWYRIGYSTVVSLFGELVDTFPFWALGKAVLSAPALHTRRANQFNQVNSQRSTFVLPVSMAEGGGSVFWVDGYKHSLRSGNTGLRVLFFFLANACPCHLETIETIVSPTRRDKFRPVILLKYWILAAYRGRSDILTMMTRYRQIPPRRRLCQWRPTP
jgi:hypothetical protein